MDFKEAEISIETRQKLLTQQNCDDIVSKHSSDIGPTPLEEMTLDTDPNLSPCCKQTKQNLKAVQL